MTLELARRVALLHGALAWLSALALVVVAVVLVRLRDAPRISRWISLACAAVTSLVTATFVSGFLLEAPFRHHLRQRLFLASRALGWLFERKNHFSFGAFVFAALALAALLAAGPHATDEASRRLRRASRFGYGIAAFFVLVACVIGTLTASHTRF